MDDVSKISNWGGEGNHYTLILKNNGALFLFNIVEGEEKHTSKYEIVKVMNNVRLNGEAGESKDFIDIANLSQESQQAIKVFTRAGLISGYGDNTFRADMVLSKMQLVFLAVHGF